MANLETMEQDIYETLHSLVSTTKIRHRIITSIQFHKDKRYFFSEREFRFDLKPGRDAYYPGDGWGLPGDLVEIIGQTLWLIPEGGTQPEPIYRVTRESMEWDRALEGGSTGEPEVWDWFEGALRLSPIPDDPDTIYGPYIRDIGVPIKRYNTTSEAWEFRTPDDSETLAGDYTSHWFDRLGGYSMVKYRALHLCFQELLQDVENSQASMTSWLEEKARLEDESEGKAGPFSITPRFW